MKPTVVAILTCLAVAAPAMAQNYGVTATTADNANFDSLETYAWLEGHGAYDRDIHRTIVAAIEQQLATAGLTTTDGHADVFVVYHTLQRTDVDLETWRDTPDASGNRADTYPVGTLVVNLLDPRTSEPLWHARIDERLELEPAQLEAQIIRAVAALFEEWPE